MRREHAQQAGHSEQLRYSLTGTACGIHAAHRAKHAARSTVMQNRSLTSAATRFARQLAHHTKATRARGTARRRRPVHGSPQILVALQAHFLAQRETLHPVVQDVNDQRRDAEGSKGEHDVLVRGLVPAGTRPAQNGVREAHSSMIREPPPAGLEKEALQI